LNHLLLFFALKSGVLSAKGDMASEVFRLLFTLKSVVLSPL